MSAKPRGRWADFSRVARAPRAQVPEDTPHLGYDDKAAPVFSNAMNGTSATIDRLLMGHNKPLPVLPRNIHAKPLAKHLKWHANEVLLASEVRINR
jgi:hypothetical protein